MLSNWHVLQGTTGKIGDPVVQPGPHDDNNIEHNRVGRLVRSHLGQAGDCAIADIEERGFDQNILELDVRPHSIARAELGDRVIKSGRTTAVTRGVVRRTDVIARIDYKGDVGPRDIGGFEIGPEDGAPPDFEVSMGGDSGSAWLIAKGDGRASDVLAGLHFAGETVGNPDEHALACYAHSVFKKLDISLAPLTDADLEDGTARGYDPAFLSEETLPPSLDAGQKEDAVMLDGIHLIPYTHFSVCMSKSRGLARFVAWNIDGSRIRKLSRKGIKFRVDTRIPGEFQQDNTLYKDNPLDRGHIARRADVVWGSEAEAKKANSESFFFTNITPQHAAFNQSSKAGLWGQLENAIFDEVDVEDLRISVIGGPVFHADDPVHRGVRIPRDYWKVLAYRDTSDDTFKARAYVLTQRDLLTDIEALELDPFRLYQVSLDKLEEETGLGLDGLKPFDTFVSGAVIEVLGETRIARAREVRGTEDLLV